MEKRAGREGKEEKTKKEEGMKLLNVIEGLYTLLWIEFILACGCIVLSCLISFEDCFYILFAGITVINGMATINLENRLRKEEEEQCSMKKEDSRTKVE